MGSTKENANVEKANELYNEIIAHWDFAEADDETGEDLYHPGNLEQVKFAKEKLLQIKKLDVTDSGVQELVETIENIINNKLQLSYDWYNQIIENWDFAEIDPETGGELSHPTSMEQVNFARMKIDEIDELKVDEPEFNQLLNNVKEITLEAPKRKFAGSKWMMIVIGIFVVLTAVGNFKSFFNRIGSYYPQDQAQAKYLSETKRLEQQVSFYERQPETSTTKNKYLKEYTKELEKHKKVSPEKYLRKLNAKERYRGLRQLINALFLIALYFGYFYASKAPVFLTNRRKKERELLRKSSGFMQKVIFGSIAAVWSTPVTTTITKWSDGSTTRDNDAIGILIVGVLFTVFILALVFYVMMIALPFLVVINYLRNYHFDKVSGIISKIKSKFGK